MSEAVFKRHQGYALEMEAFVRRVSAARTDDDVGQLMLDRIDRAGALAEYERDAVARRRKQLAGD